MLGAIVIVEAAVAEHSGRAFPTIPLACVEILGHSVLARQIAELQRGTIADGIIVLADNGLAPVRPCVEQAASGVPVKWVEDIWSAATQALQAYKDCHIETTLILRAGAYAEFDTQEILEFHRAQRKAVTRAFNTTAPLQLWIVDTDHAAETEDLRRYLAASDPACYALCGYVNRLAHPRDLRRLAIDSFGSRCRLRPAGTETRPGVWIASGAHVHRKARIVAPAFLGLGSRVEEKCLITRGCNIESNAEIDYETVVEDSSVLANSYVGIGLDITHSIVDGSHLHNLKRDVTLEITDAGIVRRLTSLRTGTNQSSPVALGLIQHSICA